MSNAHLPKDTGEQPSPASGGEQLSGTQSLLNALLSRIGLRSPSLRELLEADLKGEDKQYAFAFEIGGMF